MSVPFKGVGGGGFSLSLSKVLKPQLQAWNACKEARVKWCPVQSAGIEFAGKGLGRAKPQNCQTTWQMRFLGEMDALSTMLAGAG